MPAQIDYLPVATGTLAEVDSQENFDGSSYQQNGFTAGIAEPAEANKIWRQSSMFAAALANFISQQLSGIDVLDDGNLTNLITILTEAIQAAAGAAGAPRADVVTFNTNLVFDCSAGNANVNPLQPVFECFLTGNVTSWAFSGARPGQLITLIITQQGGPFTWPAPTGAGSTVFGAASIAPINGATSIQQFIVTETGNVRAVTGIVQS